jgi:hypothetical protein
LPCLQPANSNFKRCSVRYQPLLAKLNAEMGQHTGSNTLLMSLQAAGGVAGKRTNAFAHSFSQEVQRVRLFVTSSLEQLWMQLVDACDELRELASQQPQAGDARLPAHRAGLDAMCDQLVQLERFVRQNAEACGLLAQMHDQQQLDVPTADGTYLEAAQSALLGELRFEPLLVGLSDAYELCRTIESDAAALSGRPTKWVPPDSFYRKTRSE